MSNPGNAHAVGLFTNTKVRPRTTRYSSRPKITTVHLVNVLRVVVDLVKIVVEERRGNQKTNSPPPPPLVLAAVIAVLIKKIVEEVQEKKIKKRRRKQQRGGGGYGFNPAGFPHKGLINFNKISTCGITSKGSNLGIGKQYAPLSQKGGRWRFNLWRRWCPLL